MRSIKLSTVFMLLLVELVHYYLSNVYIWWLALCGCFDLSCLHTQQL